MKVRELIDGLDSEQQKLLGTGILMVRASQTLQAIGASAGDDEGQVEDLASRASELGTELIALFGRRLALSDRPVNVEG